MARLLLSKATLSKEQQKLKSYRRFLPSLDMKRQQLRLALKQSEQQIRTLEQEYDQLQHRVGQSLPMLANERVNLDGLVHLTEISYTEHNIAGCKVPAIESLEVVKACLPAMGKPHWVHALQELCKFQQGLVSREQELPWHQ